MTRPHKTEKQGLSACSPAKLIISGEHSVLYGQPALAMAVNRYTTATTSWRNGSLIHFKLLDLAYAKSHTYHALRRLSKNLQHEYTEFLHGKCNIRKVLKRPFELLQYSVSNLLDNLNIRLSRGVEIAVDSNIPIGCGMGSSAAAVISTLYALTNFLEFNWQRADYLAFSRKIENLQHGKSSGLDLHLVTYGGCVLFQDGKAQMRTAPNVPMYIVNTGKPLSSTGECVTKVACKFKEDAKLAAEFGLVTHAIDRAISQNNLLEFKQNIKVNHQLLKHLGVVPRKVANFIHDVELHNGAAKISGAGAIVGDNAGIVLLLGDPELQDIAHRYGYSLQTIQVDSHGTRII